MVYFKKSKITIEIESVTPAEDFLLMRGAVFALVQNCDTDSLNDGQLYWVMELIKQCEPVPKQARATASCCE